MKIKKRIIAAVELDKTDEEMLFTAAGPCNWVIRKANLVVVVTNLINRAFEQGRFHERRIIKKEEEVRQTNRGW